FRSPTIPVFANATAEAYPAAPAAVRELLASSIAKRVRFVDVVEAMYARGARTFVEVGPGAVLTSMIGRICGDRPHRAIALDRAGRHGVTSLWQGLAQVAVAGHAVDFPALWREFDLGPDPRAEPKPKMTVRISGTNYGKKYPPEGGAAGGPRPQPPPSPRCPEPRLRRPPPPGRTRTATASQPTAARGRRIAKRSRSRPRTEPPWSRAPRQGPGAAARPVTGWAL